MNDAFDAIGDTHEAAATIAAAFAVAEDDGEIPALIEKHILSDAAFRNPQRAAEVFRQLQSERHTKQAAAIWRSFVTLLDRSDEIVAENLYGDYNRALRGFLLVLERHHNDFYAYEVLSPQINAAVQAFDDIVLRPSVNTESFDKAEEKLDAGELTQAMALFHVAAEREGNPEGWLRLTQIMAELDPGDGYGIVDTGFFCKRALEAGLWHARPYFLMRLAYSLPQAEGEDRAALQGRIAQEVRAFIQDFKNNSAAEKADVSALTFNPADPAATIRKTREITRRNAVKIAIITFLQAVHFALREEALTRDDLNGLAAELVVYSRYLTDETAIIIDTLGRLGPDIASPGLGNAAMDINNLVTKQIDEIVPQLNAAV